jgi:hypothetical protein
MHVLVVTDKALSGLVSSKRLGTTSVGSRKADAASTSGHLGSREWSDDSGKYYHIRACVKPETRIQELIVAAKAPCFGADSMV